MQDLESQKKDRKGLKLVITICSFIIIGLTLLALWNLFLVGEIKKSRIEREGLKEDMEKMEILEKVNRNFIKDVLRQKAIALCFWELIGDHEEKFTNKEKQDCIQLIVMTDEKSGNKGLNAPLILAWLERESQGDPKAISDVGAKGLTQWMDYRAWNILTEMGYPGYDKNLIFNPVINLTGGLYYLNSLMNFWEWKGIKDQTAVLFYTLHSYKWSPENTEKLYITEKEASGPSAQYVDWILKRREHWENKLKYWVDDAQKLAKKWEEKSMS
jgi:hypothetical protein